MADFFQQAVDWAVYGLLRLDSSNAAARSLSFFIYDSAKIILLLFIMISLIGILRTYISPSRIKKMISGKRAGLGNIFASLFGAATPFCSCSSIPIFLSFLEAGIPLGVTFSFLITSPIVNEYMVILMIGFFGWKIAAAYAISGILIGVIAGIVLGKMKLEKYIEKDIIAKRSKKQKEAEYSNIRQRIVFGVNEANSIVKKLWIWVLAGVGIGALIHNYMPQSFVQSVIGKGGIFTVPVATLIGVPMYGSCAAIIPIALVLFQKGFPLGTVLSFMMAVSALSLPEAIILRRAMKLKLIALFFGIVTLAIIFTGYLFNALQGLLV